MLASRFNLLLVPALGIVLLMWRQRIPGFRDVSQLDTPHQAALSSRALSFAMAAICGELVYSLLVASPGFHWYVAIWLIYSVALFCQTLALCFMALFIDCSFRRVPAQGSGLFLGLVIYGTMKAMALLYNTFDGVIFSVTTANFLRLGRFFAYYAAVGGLMLLVVAVVTIKNSRGGFRRGGAAVALVLSPILFAVLIDSLIPGSMLIWQGFFLTLLLSHLVLPTVTTRIDAQTQLPNRWAAQEYLLAVTQALHRENLFIALVTVELAADGASCRCTRYSWDDRLLDLRSILRSVVPGDDFVARIGQRSFLISARGESYLLVERLSNGIAVLNKGGLRSAPLCCTISGDLLTAGDTRSPQELLRGLVNR